MASHNLGDFQRQLSAFQRDVERKVERLESLDGQHIALPDLLTEAFMQTHTTFHSAQAFFDAFPPMTVLDADNAEAIRALLETPEWDMHVVKNSPFATWSEMLGAAMQDYLRDHLA